MIFEYFIISRLLMYFEEGNRCLDILFPHNKIICEILAKRNNKNNILFITGHIIMLKIHEIEMIFTIFVCKSKFVIRNFWKWRRLSICEPVDGSENIFKVLKYVLAVNVFDFPKNYVSDRLKYTRILDKSTEFLPRWNLYFFKCFSHLFQVSGVINFFHWYFL